MIPRIEHADVVSFRLKVPRTELEAMPQASAVAGIKLALSAEDKDLVLSVVEGDSLMRFRSIGQDVVLTEIELKNDARGMFFHKVLGTLMVRFGGDLHVRLTWNTAERNSHGDHAEVKISRGSTTYPGLGASPFASLGSEGGVEGGAEDQAEHEPTPEELEVKKLLEKAQTLWAEYQKLKKKKTDG